MTIEQSILTHLMSIKETQGNIAGKLETLIAADAEHRAHISKLYELHRTCVGPRLEERINTLAAELHKHEDDTTTVRTKSDHQIARPSYAPARRTSAIPVDALVKALPIVAAVLVGTVGVVQCTYHPPAKSAEADAAPQDTANADPKD